MLLDELIIYITKQSVDYISQKKYLQTGDKTDLKKEVQCVLNKEVLEEIFTTIYERDELLGYQKNLEKTYAMFEGTFGKTATKEAVKSAFFDEIAQPFAKAFNDIVKELTDGGLNQDWIEDCDFSEGAVLKGRNMRCRTYSTLFLLITLVLVTLSGFIFEIVRAVQGKAKLGEIVAVFTSIVMLVVLVALCGRRQYKLFSMKAREEIKSQFSREIRDYLFDASELDPDTGVATSVVNLTIKKYSDLKPQANKLAISGLAKNIKKFVLMLEPEFLDDLLIVILQYFYKKEDAQIAILCLTEQKALPPAGDQKQEVDERIEEEPVNQKEQEQQRLIDIRESDEEGNDSKTGKGKGVTSLQMVLVKPSN